MRWKFENDRPIYIQIVEQVKTFIISGEYSAGERLPSVRDIAAESGVNPNTVQKALAELENSGLVRTNRTSGRFITDDEELIKKMKTEYAEKTISEVCKSLLKLGFNSTQITKLVEKNMKGGSLNE